MFKEVPSQFDFPAEEKRILEFWETERIYERSLEQRRGGPPFVFFEGPPTANGLPHPGHCLTRAIKDLFPRYKTMTGHYCLRKGGWDTHGLPVEVEVCKELGIHTKEEIEAYGIEKFNRKCLESVFRYTKEWETVTRKLGFWVNLDEAYVTYHQSYVESVWWSLKQLFDAGLLYQGYKIVWWWAQGGTALSSGEVGQGYREVDDPSVYVRFPLVMDDRARKFIADCGLHIADLNAARVSLLVWTTTPWTLPSNMFAAVHPEIEYAIVHDAKAGERLIIAKELVETIRKKVKAEAWAVEKTCKGNDLVGLRYVPPFPQCYYESESREGKKLGEWIPADQNGSRRHFFAWTVESAPFVTLDSGTGLVHEAPAFGEVDYALWVQRVWDTFAPPDNEHLLNAVAPDGKFTAEGPEYCRGLWVKDCDKDIIRDLKERVLLLHQEQYRHDYPFCWRAEEDPLIQYPRRSWFIRTTQFKDEMLANNERINWLPEHIKTGRFGKFLESNVDWSLSRERYWGTPLPIWVCESCGHMEAVDSYDSLAAKPGVNGLDVWEAAKRKEPNLSEHLKVHKPYIDAVTYHCPKCNGEADATPSRDREGAGTSPSAGPHDSRSPLPDGRGSDRSGRMKRVPEVIDCWYDSGAMPFAQWGFPHKNREMFASQYPADFISEALDQTRGWFYSLTAIATLLFGPKGAARAGSAGVSPAQHAQIRSALRAPITQALSTRKRWKLPHWGMGGSTYFLTFRHRKGTLSEGERTIVLDACRHWHAQRMDLHAAVVMPDHVHLLITPRQRADGEWWSLADLLHSIKSFTSHEISRLRGDNAPIWQPEYFDRIIRNDRDFQEKWNYIVENAVRAGLGDAYPWVCVERDDGSLEVAEPLPGDNRQNAHDLGGRDAHSPLGGRDAHSPLGGRDAHSPLGGRDAHSPECNPQPAILYPQSDYPQPFRTCIVLGLLMGEDGLKMSKSKKNYKEPTYIFEKEGADAMRWLFFSGQAPWTSIRFQEAAIAEGQREFLIRLYNCYSFFVIYANIDNWTPDPATVGQGESLPCPHASELDRWILSELAACSVRVYDCMEAYDNYAAARALIDFVDALSNWYVRRSRDRFWRGGMDDDKRAAYATLHQCLVTTCRLIAPFTPFFAESMYQNLARRHDPGAPMSVHLCDYPVMSASQAQAVRANVDERLRDEIAHVRRVVSAGRAARAKLKLRVRQPLASLELFHRAPEYIRKHEAAIKDELNIKRIDYVSSTEIDEYVHYELKPDFKKIGPKFGALAPKIKAALAAVRDVQALVKELEQAGTCALSVDGKAIALSAEELMVELHAREGWAAERIPGCGILALDTQITPELRDEGLARDLVNRVQQVRKDQNLKYEQRIDLAIIGDEEIRRVVSAHAPAIMSETLAKNLLSTPITGVVPAAADIEGHPVQIHVKPL